MKDKLFVIVIIIACIISLAIFGYTMYKNAQDVQPIRWEELK